MQRTFRIECCSFLKWTLMFQPVTKLKNCKEKQICNFKNDEK